jgi:Phosphate-induced protein 1 conserved region
MGLSAWWGISKKYYFQASADSPKVYVSDQVAVKKTVQDNYSLGKSLSGNNLPAIIQQKITDNELPEDTNAIYFVLVSI